MLLPLMYLLVHLIALHHVCDSALCCSGGFSCHPHSEHIDGICWGQVAKGVTQLLGSKLLYSSSEILPVKIQRLSCEEAALGDLLKERGQQIGTHLSSSCLMVYKYAATTFSIGDQRLLVLAHRAIVPSHHHSFAYKGSPLHAEVDLGALRGAGVGGPPVLEELADEFHGDVITGDAVSRGVVDHQADVSTALVRRLHHVRVPGVSHLPVTGLPACKRHHGGEEC